jgi:FkbM family methyltransferase
MNEVRMLRLLPELLHTFGNPIRVVELGANDGAHTVQIINLLNASGRPWEYLAVEPDPRLPIPQLPAQAKFLTCAVGATNGKAQLYLSAGKDDHGMAYSGSSSLRPPTDLLRKSWPKMRFDDFIEVNVYTLDTLCHTMGFPYIDFIWCDIQGCEGDLVAGGRNMLPYTKWFFTEYSAGELYAGQALLGDLVQAMPYMTIHTDFGGDVLFKNRAVA